jgi:hypothetical protein
MLVLNYSKASVHYHRLTFKINLRLFDPRLFTTILSHSTLSYFKLFNLRLLLVIPPLTIIGYYKIFQPKLFLTI